MDITKARSEILMGKTIYEMNLRVADYGRVSTDKDDQINSLENQINFFKDLISSVKKWTHVGSYSDEGISGTQVYKREQFLKMLEDARLGKIDLIITKEVSRFARNTIDSIKYTEELLKYGVIVLFLSDNINTINPDSEFRLTLMASMAQDEVRKLSERVKFGIKRSIKDGKLGGGSLCGYIKKDGKLTINDQESPVVKKLFELYSTGEYGFKKIGQILAEDGYLTKKGKIYSDTTLKKMLKNPRYKGYYTANLTEVSDYKTHKKVAKPRQEWIIYKDETGNIPPIVSEEIWDKANKIYEQKNNNWSKTVTNRECFLENKKYTSKLFCQEHTTSFIRAGSSKRKNNPTWQCNEYLRHGLKGCLTPILKEKYLDKIFISILNKFINKNKILDKILKDYTELIKEHHLSDNIEKLKINLKEQETYKERLLDMSLRKMITDEEFEIKNTKLKEKINNLNIQLKQYKSTKESLSYQNDINNLKIFLNSKLDIKNNIHKYFDIFVDKVIISKINNNRKHIKLEIIFNFNYPNEILELNLDNVNTL